MVIGLLTGVVIGFIVGLVYAKINDFF